MYNCMYIVSCEQCMSYLCATGSLVYGHSYFGYGDGPVMMINPECYRYSNRLSDCYQRFFRSNGLTHTHCGMNEIQGLFCESKGFKN